MPIVQISFASRKSENLTIGVFHDLSKRPSLFGGYQHVDVADNNTLAKHDRNTWAGMRHNF